VGWLSWGEIAEKWIASQGDAELTKEFVNTVLGETWQARGDAPEWQDVYRRRDTYRSGTVPRGTLILFAGVDVQKDRLEAGVWGFGRNRERWLIEHRILMGSTERPDVWAALASMMDETWPHESGAEMAVRDWGIDSGAFAPEVGAFVRAQAGRGNVHAVDGHDAYTAAFLGLGHMEFSARGQKVKHGLKTIKVGVSFCKQELVAQLGLDRSDGTTLPGTVHLPGDVTEDAVKQLTSESLMSRTERGRVKREWVVMEGRRNEVLDCANYARGLAAMRGWDRWKEPRFAELEALLLDTAATPEPAPAPMTPAQEALAAMQARQQAPVQRPGWLGDRHQNWFGRRD
jgi:phage terminase large subunit GpA-like protein